MKINDYRQADWVLSRANWLRVTTRTIEVWIRNSQNTMIMEKKQINQNLELKKLKGAKQI